MGGEFLDHALREKRWIPLFTVPAALLSGFPRRVEGGFGSAGSHHHAAAQRH
jgi:hypothetical protein